MTERPLPPRAPLPRRSPGGRKGKTSRDKISRHQLFDPCLVLSATDAAVLALPKSARSTPPRHRENPMTMTGKQPDTQSRSEDPDGGLSGILNGAFLGGERGGPKKQLPLIDPPEEQEEEEEEVIIEAEEERPTTKEKKKRNNAESSDLNEDALRTFGIKTGTDAINFFSSQAGSQSSIKFVHLMQGEAAPPSLLLPEEAGRKPPSTFRPYDLVAVRATGTVLAQKKLAYYTMSSEGLVLMKPGETSEFIPLTQWMRESACFNLLTSIPFFRNNLRSKCFNAWRSNVSFLQFCRQRKHLKDRLFLGMPSFCKALLVLRRHMHGMQQIRLLEPGNRTFESATFVEKQFAARTEAAKHLEANLEQAASAVYAVCKETTASAKPPDSKNKHVAGASALVTAANRAALEAAQKKLDEKNGALNENNIKEEKKDKEEKPKDEKEKEAEEKAELAKKKKKQKQQQENDSELDVVSRVIAQMEEQDKPQSMSALRDALVERKARLRRAVHECNLLPEFIRLADYIAVESLSRLVISTWAGFLAELLRPRRQSGLLETTIRFTEEGSNFVPACSAIQNVLAQTADSLITMVGGVMRILHLRPLAKYFPQQHQQQLQQQQFQQQQLLLQLTQAEKQAAPSSNTPSAASKSAPNVLEIIRNDSDFKATALAMNGKVEADFRKAQEYVVVAFDKVWPIYEYSRKWDFEAYKRQAHTVASLKKEMEKVAGWEKEMEKMRTRQTCGMLEVESRKLRQMLIPMTNEKMEALKHLVKDLSRAKCKDQRNKYKAAISKIAPRPTHLNGFTFLLERVDEQRVQARSLFKHTQIVEQMYQMLNHYEVRIGDTDLVQLDELRSIQSKYQEELESTQAFRDEHLPEMLGQLETTISRFNDQVMTLARELEKGLFVDIVKMSVPATVLHELEVVKTKLDNFSQQDAAHRKQQNLFATVRLSHTSTSANVTKDAEASSTAMVVAASSVKTPLGRAASRSFGNTDGSTSAARKSKALEMASEAYERMRTLWTMVERWDEDFSSWTHDDFLSHDVLAIERDVDLYHRGATGLAKKLRNPVVQRLVDQTSTLKDKMPIIKMLSDKALLQSADYWEIIFERIGEVCPADLKFTLDQLIKAGVMQHKTFISAMVNKARAEVTHNDVLKLLQDMVDKVVEREGGGEEEAAGELEGNQQPRPSSAATPAPP